MLIHALFQNDGGLSNITPLARESQEVDSSSSHAGRGESVGQDVNDAVPAETGSFVDSGTEGARDLAAFDESPAGADGRAWQLVDMFRHVDSRDVDVAVGGPNPNDAVAANFPARTRERLRPIGLILLW